jgi:Beta-propeller repeat
LALKKHQPSVNRYFFNNLKLSIMNSNKYIFCLFCFFLCLNTEGGYAQVAINTDGSAPNPNAILDLKSTNKAFLPPRMTNGQIKSIPNPTEGMLAYDTEFKCLRMYTGLEWQCQQGSNKELNDPPGDFFILGTATGYANPQATTTDAAGNVYVTGVFAGTTTFGTTTLTSNGPNPDAFVVKYNASGVVQWAVNGGGTSDDFINGIAVDGSGNVYITGYSSGATTFGTTTLTGGYVDFFVVKYNASGVVQWAVKGVGDREDSAYGIAVDGSGNVYLTGFFYSTTVSFGTTTLTNTSSNFLGSDVFVVKYNASGVVQWAVNSGGTDAELGTDIAVDGSGNVYITGYFSSATAVFGPTASAPFSISLTNNSSGGHEVFVVKYNTNGQVQWAVKGGGTNNDQGDGIAVDGSGNVYVTGSFEGIATFGSTTLTSSGSADVFVAKYNTNGVAQWAVKGGGTSDDIVKGISIDVSGNCYIIGNFNSPTTSFSSITSFFGSATLTNTNTGSNNTRDVFVAKYNTSGAIQWVVKGGGVSDDFGNAIAVNASGTRVYTAVQYSPNAKFGNNILKTGKYLLWMYGE